jgi:hypothetical protein
MARVNLFTALFAKQKFQTRWCAETAAQSSAADVELRSKKSMSSESGKSRG